MIFFVYWKASPDAPWTVYGTYETEEQAQSRIGRLFGEGLQSRLVTS
jgi:hypothetical protein